MLKTTRKENLCQTFSPQQDQCKTPMNLFSESPGS